MEECSCCFWKDKGADICRSCHGEGKAPMCGACIHKAVCVYRMNAEAIMAAMADIMKREEAKCGIFTVSIKCDHFIEGAGTAAK